jgi:hypothetical protein
LLLLAKRPRCGGHRAARLPARAATVATGPPGCRPARLSTPAAAVAGPRCLLANRRRCGGHRAARLPARAAAAAMPADTIAGPVEGSADASFRRPTSRVLR